MSKNVFALSTGATCEPAKLIVQVVGNNHPDSQRLVIYDQTDSEHQEWLTQQDQPELEESDSFSSVLHVWTWDAQPKRHLWLEVAASEGGPIRLPLSDDLRQTPRQPEHHAQWNQIVPVVPMTALPCSQNRDDLGTPVSLRNGYVYVFYRGQVWRELEVRTADSGTTFHDVDVARYRSGTGFKPGPRMATGVGLDDIWLPSQWNGRRELAVQLCFSEIQLSAVRLARLEHDNVLRRARSSQRQLEVSKARFDEMFKGKPGGKEIIEAYKDAFASGQHQQDARLVRMNLDLWAFPVSMAAPQRGRQPGYEWMLDHPGRYVCDLSGRFPVSSKTAAQKFLDGCQAGNIEPAEPFLEMEALACCMEQRIAPHRQICVPDGAELWEAQPAAADVLAQARSRQLCAFLLDDHQYRVRHLHARIEVHQRLLQLCAEYAKTNSHHASALLIQQSIVPRSVGGAENKLHASIGKITPAGLKDLNCFTATIERMEVWQAMHASQQSLVDVLEKPACQQTLADHLSQGGFAYTAALHYAAQVFSSLATTAADHDPLANNASQLVDAVAGRLCYSQKDSPGRKFILTTAEQTQNPLHVMLWPKYDLAKLEQPYVKPQQPDVNAGDGCFRATELAAQEGLEAPGEAQTTVDTIQVQSLLEKGGLASAVIVDGKLVANALISIYEHLDGAIRSATSGLEQAKQEHAAASQGSDKAQNQRDTAQRDQQKATRQRQQAEQAQRGAERRQGAAQAEVEGRELAKDRAEGLENMTRQRLAAGAKPLNIRLHGMSVEQLRSMLSVHFGELRLMRRSAALAGNYYIFALSDLPLEIQRTIRVYGELQDANGRVIGSSNSRKASRQRLPANTADHMVTAIPADHRTARLVNELNRRVNARVAADQAVQVAKMARSDAAAKVRAAGVDVEAARRSKDAMELRLRQAKELAQAANEELQAAEKNIQDLTRSVDAGQRNLYFQALSSGAFSMAVLSLEFWNLFVEWAAKSNTEQQKGRYRAVFGVGSAVIDTAIALENLAFKMKEANRFAAFFRANRWTVNTQAMSSLLGKALGEKLVTQISVRLLTSAAAGIVMMFVCVMDAIHAWRWGDDAVWGYGVMATGALFGAIATFFSGSGVLFGLNPFSLTSLLLIVLGAGVVFWLSSTQLDDWLENGPFGEKKLDYLAGDAMEAFYRLAGIFAGIRIAIERNPHYRPDAKLDSNADPEQRDLASFNTLIRITSNLPGMLAHLGDMRIEAHCRLRTREIRYRGNGDPYPAIVKIPDVRPLKRALPEGQELYLHMPDARRWTGDLRDTSLHHDLQVRAQFRLELDAGGKGDRPSALVWLFPAPPIRNGKADASKAPSPDFNTTDLPFWADEKTHAESQ